jgi:solute carrier family 25 2-oxodicarboxylate transporter 21
MAQRKQSVWATLPPITCGAFATATIMYPVDLVRALTMSAAGDGAKQSTVQLIQAFHKQHGLKGFATQGVAPEMLRATYMRVLKFFLFPICHKSMFGKPESQGNALTKGLAAGLASLPEGFTIQPIEVAKIALQLDKDNKYKNKPSAVIKDILKNRGWTGLFIGYTGVQYRQTSWTAVYFASLSFFQDQSKLVIPKDWKMLQDLSGGFAAGMFGAAFNTPGDVIRSTQQKATLAAAPEKRPFSVGLCVSGITDFVAVGANIARTKGVPALWTGFGFKALHLGGSGALLAMLIPQFKILFGVQ